ncbi:ubiquitin-protein ligase E3C-like isoform X2 [Dreissena polymorpha]|nr:ubiquitin-protein ligase E3C-like isoform X2 [Dreissena polymorpha]
MEQKGAMQFQFDKMKTMVGKGPYTENTLQEFVKLICKFYADKVDGERLVWLCQLLVKHKDVYLRILTSDSTQGHLQIKNILTLCLRYLTSIVDSGQSIAIPMRMLEVFTTPTTLQNPNFLKTLWRCLIEKGYFECMRRLLEHKVPGSMERGPQPPTPVAGSILDLVMQPICYAAQCKDSAFSQQVLSYVCKTLLCPAYSEQVSQFLIPAMAYGKYPFPFVDLITTLITGSKEQGAGKNKGSGQSSSEKPAPIEKTAWLLGAFVTLGAKALDDLPHSAVCGYLQVIQWLLPSLPAARDDDDDDDDSDEEEDMETDDDSELAEVREACLSALDSHTHVSQIVGLVGKVHCKAPVLHAVAVICHCLISQHRYSIHRRRMLFSLAYNPTFIRNLWKFCVQESTVTHTRETKPLIHLLSCSQAMEGTDMARIVPLLSTFCSMFSHSLHTLHDADFYGGIKGPGSSMPFELKEVENMSMALRDVCLGILELAHPDARPTVNDDYRRVLANKGQRKDTKELSKETKEWGSLFKVVAGLVRQIYTRDSRKSFCGKNHWLTDRFKIIADAPSQIYGSSMLVRRPFVTMQSLTRINAEEGGPPLSNRDVKNLVILTELPFVVAFHERVKIFHKFLQKDKEEFQTETSQFIGTRSVSVMIRRNYIYEDAFEKLSLDNEPNLKYKMRVQLVNAAGMDEAGIDGGGIFREFLGQLLKTGFDPNRGFFSQTTDSGRLLFPNQQSALLVDNFEQHYFFLGRMLGKAIYENMLVELPMASFFLSKLLSRHLGNLDIDHLASLDPEIYKNLLFLKHYEGDVSDLGLDFTVAGDEFGKTKVVELKHGGRNIPVTTNNRIEYIHLMADFYLNKRIHKQCAAFRNGLSDLLNLEWLRMFDQQELQVLISGAAVPIDIDDLRTYTNYSGGYAADHPVIKMFWEIVEDFTDEQKRQLLKFITSCSRPPLLGFKELYPAFCIHNAGREADRLPTASTCMNLLKLPEFHDYGMLRDKLLYSIESEAGFELS